MGEQYFKGVLAGYLGANFMCGPITEWQIDIIKENISHYCEATIDHSQLSYQERQYLSPWFPYFQNKDQMAPYRPGSGAIAESIDHLLYKLKSYVNQVQPDASYVINSGS